MTKSDVKFVTGLDGLDFGYAIMPTRADSASSHDFVGKDIVYLSEAAEEMRNVLGVEMPSAPVDMTDLSLLAARPCAIATAFAGAENTETALMTNGAPIEQGELYQAASDSSWAFSGHPEWWSGVKVLPSAFVSKPGDFYVGAVAEYEPIMRLFRDSQRVKSCAHLRGTHTETGITYTDTEGGYHYAPSHSGIYWHAAVDLNSGPYWEQTGWTHSVVSGGSYTIASYHDYGIPFTARAYLAITTDYNFDGRADRAFVDVARLNATASGGKITVAAAQLASVTSRIVSAHGIQVVHPTPNEGSTANYNESISMSITDAAYQIVRGSHTLYA